MPCEFSCICSRGSQTPKRFLENYDHFVAACASYSIRPLVVIFDDDFVDAPGVESVTDILAYMASRQYRNASWLENPGMPVLDFDVKRGFELSRRFAAAVTGGSRANDRRILGYDIMNEPHRGGLQPFIASMFETINAAADVTTTVDAYTYVPHPGNGPERGLSFHTYWRYGHWQE